MFDIIELGLEERILTGASHCVRIDFNKLAETASTSVALTVGSGVARDIVRGAWFDLVTPFDGGATSELTVQFGYDLAAGTDDADAFIAATSVHLDATEILASNGTGTKLAAQEAFDLEVLFTATGANLSTLTAGQINLYFDWIKTTKSLRGING
jgi:hypothetical protein